MTFDYDRATWVALQEDLTAPDGGVNIATTVLEELQATNSHLMEQLRDVQMMFALEDRGWDSIFGGLANDNTSGLSLTQLKETAAKIQNYIVGNPIIKRGTELRASYVWSKGVNISGVNDDPSKRGPKSGVEKFWRTNGVTRYLGSPRSHGEMERAAVAAGAYMLLGNDSTNTIISPVPLSEITGVFLNPDYAGDVWAYKRSWQTLNEAGQPEERESWYYTDRYEGVRKTQIGAEGSKVPVAANRTIIDQTFNSQVGWPLGVPDGLAAIVWARIYSELMTHGRVMTESLAKFAMKVTTKSATGATNVGVKLAGNGGSGQTAVIGAGNDLTPLSSAGKAYDFDGIRAVAAMVATSLEVSIVHLLSDPGAAGSSYGSASNLDLPTKRAMVSRQNLWGDYVARIIKWATGTDVDVSFPALDDPDPYREAQIAALAWNTGLVHEDEARPSVLKAANIQSLHAKAPDGVMLPNNEKSWARNDIDPKVNPNGGSVPATAASPDQGVANGSGGTPGDVKGDQRADTISQSLKRMQDEDFLGQLRELVERLEIAKSA